MKPSDRIELDTREKKLILLKWLQRGCIIPSEFPELITRIEIEIIDKAGNVRRDGEELN